MINKLGHFVKRTNAAGCPDWLRKAFPEREFFMRSQGNVRFIKVSSRTQFLLFALCASLALIWISAIASMGLSALQGRQDKVELATREARANTAEQRINTYRQGVDDKAQDLEERQRYVESLVEAHLGDSPSETPLTGEGEQPKNSPTKHPAGAHTISANVSETDRLARIEAAQIAFVERLTLQADERANHAAASIRQLGLNPKSIQAAAEKNRAEAMGGPLISLKKAGKQLDDPRFQRLASSLERMSALEAGLAGIPQVAPAHVEMVTSSYGYRSDPFTGEAAFHSGLDFRGPHGAPIYAAAPGRVISASNRSGYGLCIDIDHGNGIVTRYAHLSGFKARVGDQVAAGDVIAALGSTGRSTGPHLHFEVRVNDRPTNPRPFLTAQRQNAASTAHTMH